ncbi:MAG: heavy metal-responsive transcriptional regulator [Xanthomonadaceae bacterium]|nr:heavy metal-responsive transcriptional regulator [Xanthomonadaceae bacterium]
MEKPTVSRYFTIGALSAKTGVPADTLRYYERERLLAPARRTASGYRQYGDDAIERIRCIRRGKALGFNLAEIRELLVLENDRTQGVKGVRQRAVQRLAEMDQRIELLLDIRAELARLIAACPGEGAPECCPILSSIHGAGSAVK